MSRTEAQSRDALRAANHNRLEQAAIKKEIAALSRIEGMERLVGMIEAGGLRRIRVYDALSWPRGMGRTRVDRIWFEVAAPPWPADKTFGALTDRQRGRLVKVLRERATRLP